MKLLQWSKRASVDKQAGKMLRVTEREALEIIASLSAQLLNRSPNTGRAEFTRCVLDGVKREEIYFSIVVDFQTPKATP